MARAKKDNAKKHRMIRYVAVCVLWALLLFAMLACVTYKVNQRMLIPDRNLTGAIQDGVVPNHLVGPLGTTLAFLALENIGPGVFVGLILLAALLVVWTRGEPLSDWGLRIVGSVLLVIVVSATFHLMKGGQGLPVQTGGYLGTAVGEFLHERFGIAGTVLILLVTVIVGLLLVADELMLGLPAKLLYTWSRVPKRQLAGSAATVAGGFWGHVRDFVEALGSRGHMGRKSTPRAGSRRVLEATGGVGIAVGAGTAGPTPPEAAGFTAGGERIKVPGEDEDDDAAPVPPLAPPGDAAAGGGGPVVRKPTAAAKGPMLPFKPLAPTPAPKAQDLGNYKIPGLDLLDEAEPLNVTGQEQRVREKARVLEKSLESFGLEAKVEAIETGPVVTMYELTLGLGIKSSQVGALSKDVARALKSPPVRIIDNIPGKSTMGIEVPNMDRERVRLKELMVLGHDQIERMALPMCLGKDAAGNPLIEDLTRMPHMLIAGTTGSGKSVCINSIIMTMLLTQRPDHVKMIMVDPKMVEMQDYKSIPHLMAPIIDDMAKAESILEWATQKMDERYEVLSEAGVRHIKEFNKLTKEQICERFEAKTEEDKARLVFHLPYIVIIIDELADLMMTSKDVEGHIVRIAQKARAVGIHLILATQRPEAQVVTGLIKSNMPGRICFQVRSRLDSRIMLDQSGGELLLGQGDLLMLKPTGGGMVRGQ
ncbi:MAG: DNA translocase FtsK 4TM domain-containing protein, partial [Phycisphaerae bacterium]